MNRMFDFPDGVWDMDEDRHITDIIFSEICNNEGDNLYPKNKAQNNQDKECE